MRVFQAKLLLSWVRGVRQDKTEKKKAKEKHKERKQQGKKAKKKKKKRGQYKKERERITQPNMEEVKKENRKEKEVLWTRQCLNHAHDCHKEKNKREDQ